MTNSITETTRDYWLQVLLGWAEDRLMPPQFEECKRVLDEVRRLPAVQGRNRELIAVLDRLRASLEHVQYMHVSATLRGQIDVLLDTVTVEDVTNG